MAKSNPETTSPAPAFGRWLLQQYRRWFVILPSLASLGALATVISAVLNLIQSQWFRHGLFLAQLMLCCLLLILIPPTRADARISGRAAKATEQFLEAWKRLWLFWIMLYGIFLLRETLTSFLAARPGPCQQLFATYHDSKIPSNVMPQLWSCDWYLSTWKAAWGWMLDVANNLQTLSLVMLYLVVTKSTVDPKQKDSKLPWAAGIGVLAAISLLHLIVVFGSAMQSPFILSPERFEVARKIFTWSSGFFAGIAIALVVGRFDSKNIDPPTWAVVLLYTYALIQVPWGAFETTSAMEPVIISAALLLKCLLFLFVAWLLETGILFFFVDRVAYLIMNSRQARDEYLKRLAEADGSDEGASGQQAPVI